MVQTAKQAAIRHPAEARPACPTDTEPFNHLVIGHMKVKWGPAYQPPSQERRFRRLAERARNGRDPVSGRLRAHGVPVVAPAAITLSNKMR